MKSNNTTTGPPADDLFAFRLMGLDFVTIHCAIIYIEGVAIIVTNIGAIVLIARNRVLYKSPTNILMLSNCLADVLYALPTMISTLLMVISVSSSSKAQSWITSRLFLTLPTSAMFCSVMITMHIALERSVATFRPLMYKIWITPKRTIVLSIVTWLYIIMLFFGSALWTFMNSTDEEKFTIQHDLEEVIGKMNTRTYIAAHFYIPLQTSIIAYISISYRLYKQSKVGIVGGTAKDQRNNSLSVKITKTSSKLLVLMLATLAPFTVLTSIFQPPDPLEDARGYRIARRVGFIVTIPYTAYNFLNIIFYAYNHKDFRHIILKQLKCCKKKPDSNNELVTVTVSTN